MLQALYLLVAFIESNFVYSFPKSVKSGKNYASLSQSDGKRKNEHLFKRFLLYSFILILINILIRKVDLDQPRLVLVFCRTHQGNPPST